MSRVVLETPATLAEDLAQPVTARPDWVCERISPPEEQTLTVFRYGAGGHVAVLTATSDEVATARPFDEPREE